MMRSYSRGFGFSENSPNGSMCWLAVCMVSTPTYTNDHFPIVEPFGGVFSSTCIEMHDDVPTARNLRFALLSRFRVASFSDRFVTSLLSA